MLLLGESRRTLAMTRAFSRRGIKVFVGGSGRFSRSFFSKHCSGFFFYPKAKESMEASHDTILKNVKKFEPDAILPVGIQDNMLLTRYHDEYAKLTAIPPIAGKEVFNNVNDKIRLFALAKKHDIPYPKTYFPKSEQEVKELSRSLSYPILIKPRISESGIGIECVHTPEELLVKYKKLAKRKSMLYNDFSMPFIQEYIPERSTSVNALLYKKKIVAKLVRKTLRNYPAFGPPIATVTIKDSATEELALKLLKKIGWEGVADIQFIVDPKDSVPKLIDFNPRFWGTVESAISAGVDFPYLLYQLALGEKVEQVTSYPLGNKFRWICYGEFAYLASNFSRKTLKEMLNFSNCSYDISFSDPFPHLAHILNLVVFKQVL
jgi:predicted ATP-grasp superfamily ATP-dependent carboligase